MEVSIETYLQNLKAVINNLPNQFDRILDSQKDAILDLNRETQLNEQGIDSKGRKLQEYRPFTIEIKKLIGQPYDRTTLFYSGKFYEGFTIQPLGNYRFDIFSTDSKTTMLQKKYTKHIFGLTKSNAEYLDNNIIKKEIDKWILSKM